MALSIFAVMSVLTYSGMDRVIRYSDQVQATTQELEQLQLAFALIKNDLEQAIDRPVRDNLGTRKPGFMSNPNDDIELELTTQTRSSLQLQATVSYLQRVGYRLHDNTLIRDIWPTLDRAHNTEPRSIALLDNIESFEISFINNQEHTFWPLPNGHQDYRVLPRAVRILITPKEKQAIERLVLLSSL